MHQPTEYLSSNNPTRDTHAISYLAFPLDPLFFVPILFSLKTARMPAFFFVAGGAMPGPHLGFERSYSHKVGSHKVVLSLIDRDVSVCKQLPAPLPSDSVS